jgi:hypothetical protein
VGFLNQWGEGVKKEAARAQQVPVSVPVPGFPGYQPPIGSPGWQNNAARWQQDMARNWQEQMRAVGAQQAQNIKPPQVPQPPSMPGWRPR